MSTMIITKHIPKWFSEPLSAHGVRVVQRKLLLPVTGVQDANFRMAVKGWQAHNGLPQTGEVDVWCANLLGESEEYATPPEWYTDNLAHDGDAVDRFLAQHGWDLNWLRRLQGTNGGKPTGLIDVDTAWRIEREK